jgi:phenylacetate 2-hydroxylase
MAVPIIPVAGALVVFFFIYRWLYATDTPKIEGIPEIPGLPLFGSLFELGTNHAKVAQGWAKKYGPVFQVRMGNRVSTSSANFGITLHANIMTSGSSSPIPLTRSDTCGSPTNPL